MPGFENLTIETIRRLEGFTGQVSSTVRLSTASRQLNEDLSAEGRHLRTHVQTERSVQHWIAWIDVDNTGFWARLDPPAVHAIRLSLLGIAVQLRIAQLIRRGAYEHQDDPL